MGVRRFFKYLRDTATDQFNPEIDEVRSEYPTNLTSGIYNFTAEQTRTSLLAAVSSKVFKLREVWLFNSLGTPNLVRLYDGTACATFMPLMVAASYTARYDNIRGANFQTVPIASNLDSGLTIRILGILVESGQV